MAQLPRAALLAALTLLPVALAGTAASSHTAWAGALGADVRVVAFQFAPAVIVASPGDTITWLGNAPHTITSDEGIPGLADASDGATFNFLGSGSWTVPASAGPGVLLYYCKPHMLLGMRGVILIV